MILKRMTASPLKGLEDVIENIESNKEGLIGRLFTELGMTQPASLQDVDLKAMDTKIRKYGYRRASEDLYLPLIVFSGEYIRERKGGTWRVEKNPSYPTELRPVFVGSSGRNYSFEINLQIRKKLLGKGKFSIAQILEFSLIANKVK